MFVRYLNPWVYEGLKRQWALGVSVKSMKMKIFRAVFAYEMDALDEIYSYVNNAKLTKTIIHLQHFII